MAQYVITLLGKIKGASAEERLYFKSNRYTPNEFVSSIDNATFFNEWHDIWRFIGDCENIQRSHLANALNNLAEYKEGSIEICKLMLKPGKVMDKIDLSIDYETKYNEYIEERNKQLTAAELEKKKKDESIKCGEEDYSS